MIMIFQLCGMKNQHNTISGILVLITLGLVAGLCYLQHTKIVNWDLELVLAPFIVITLLAFGEKLLVYFFILPICSIYRIISKTGLLSKTNS